MTPRTKLIALIGAPLLFAIFGFIVAAVRTSLTPGSFERTIAADRIPETTLEFGAAGFVIAIVAVGVAGSAKPPSS